MDDRDRDRGAWARYRDPREREDDRDRYRYYDDRDRISDPGHPSRPPPRWMEEPAARLQQCVLGRLSLLNINISMPAFSVLLDIQGLSSPSLCLRRPSLGRSSFAQQYLD